MKFNRDKDFDSESYVRVNTRLAEFWAKYPEGRLETSYEVAEGVLVMRAALYRTQQDQNPSATGHAFLESLDGEKVGEYTETVAVGRALALMGFQVEKGIASQEEMKRFNNRKAERQKAPVEQDAEPALPSEIPKLKAASKFNMSKFKKVSVDSAE